MDPIMRGRVKKLEQEAALTMHCRMLDHPGDCKVKLGSKSKSFFGSVFSVKRCVVIAKSVRLRKHCRRVLIRDPLPALLLLGNV